MNPAINDSEARRIIGSVVQRGLRYDGELFYEDVQAVTTYLDAHNRVWNKIASCLESMIAATKEVKRLGRDLRSNPHSPQTTNDLRYYNGEIERLTKFVIGLGHASTTWKLVTA